MRCYGRQRIYGSFIYLSQLATCFIGCNAQVSYPVLGLALLDRKMDDETLFRDWSSENKGRNGAKTKSRTSL